MTSFCETKQVFDLEERDRSLLIHALRIAAERYDEDRKVFDELPESTMTTDARNGLSKVFADQARWCRDMADRMEEAEFIRIGKVYAGDE